MKSRTILTTLFILFAILLAACSMPVAGNPTVNPDFIFTQAAQTLQALPTNLPVTAQPTSGVTQVMPSPTIHILPSATSTPIPTATFTSTPTSTPGSCTNLVQFVEDVTIPDGSEVLPGEEFIKTWRLMNTGTCTWNHQYALSFVSGDQMNGSSPLPLTGSAAPGATLDVSITLKAPGTAGSYLGNWEMKSPDGVTFGTGVRSDQPFYVDIKVVEGVSELNLGNPSWTDNMDDAGNWYLLDTADTKYTEGDGKLVMTSFNPGKAEEWNISNQPSMNDYYLQATFITGDSCSGLDRYGVLVRAPDPNKGYVYEFTCDGHYRLYTWDGSNYKAVQEWSLASSIHTGPDQTNMMGIWMKGTDIRLYANNHKIAEFTDSTFDHGQFGLAIGSVNTKDFTVFVDQVSYWKFDQ